MFHFNYLSEESEDEFVNIEEDPYDSSDDEVDEIDPDDLIHLRAELPIKGDNSEAAARSS